jgi:serine/threonine protein phosphatase PrpC
LNSLEDKNDNASIQKAIKTAFLETDKCICDNLEEFGKAGSTAAVAMVRVNDYNEKWLYTANVGDARVIIW